MFSLASDKSDVIRKLIISTFSNIPLKLHHVESCDDIDNTYEVLDDLGANIKVLDDKIIVKGYKENKCDEIYIDESASLLRFIIPFLVGRRIVIHSTSQLINRPIDVYFDLFKDNIKIENNDYIIDLVNFDKSKLMDLEFSDLKSSQFISGLLMYQAIVLNKGKIVLNGEIVSQSYIDKTIENLGIFGYNINVEHLENKTIYSTGEIKKIKSVDALCKVDENSIGYMLAIAGVNKKELSIKTLFDLFNISKDYFEIFKKIGFNFEIKENELIVLESNLIGCDIDIINHIDIAPLLMVIGCFTKGFITLLGTKNLVYKESNRILAMKSELLKVGVELIIGDNSVTIDNSGFKNLDSSVMLNTSGDHRIAMSLIVLNSYFNDCSLLDNLRCIDKSYPSFLEDYVEISNLMEE